MSEACSHIAAVLSCIVKSVAVANNEEVVMEISQSVDENETDNEDYEKVWCYCNTPSYGQMILCDNDACMIQWFYCDCLRIRKVPKGTWRCPSCRKLRKTKAKRQRRL